MKKIILILVLLTTFKAGSQELIDKLNERWRWVKYDKSTGLPSDRSIRLVESEDGTLWALTMKGFAWFDGYYWHDVKSKYNFSLVEILIAQSDENGLISVHNGKLVKIRKNGIQLKQIDVPQKNIVLFNVIKNKKNYFLLFKDLNNNNGYIYTLNNDTLTREKHPKIKIIDNFYIYFMKDKNYIWLNSSNGLFFKKNNNWIKLKSIKTNHPLDITFPINNHDKTYFAIAFPNQIRGIWSFDSKTNVPIKTYRNEVVLRDLAGFESYIIGINELGNLELYSKNKKLIFNNFPNDLESPFRLYKDKKNNLWISGEKGLYLVKLNKDRWNVIYDTQNLGNNLINDFILQKNELITATDNGLIIMNNNVIKHKYSKVNNTPLSGITGLNIDQNNNIWISSGGNFAGAYKFDGKKWEHFDFEVERNPAFFHKIRKDRKGNLWFLSISGSSQFSGFGAFQMIDDSIKIWNSTKGLVSDRVYDFANDSSDAYWFATLNGLCRYYDNKWTYWNSDNGLRNNKIYTLSVDKNNVLWFADYFGGVGYIDKKDKVNYINVLDDDEIVKVNAITFDELNNPWITSKSGVYYLNNKSVSQFNKEMGMKTSACWPIIVKKDKVYIGTLGGGVNILNTNERNEPLPKIVISSITEKSESIHIIWKVFSYYGQIPKENILIRYKVDENIWSKWSTIRELFLTDLHYGDHIFYIQAKGIFGDFEGTTIKAKFNIPYPVYLTPWFLIPVIVSLYLIGLYFYKENQRKKQERIKLKEDKIKLEREVKEKTKALSKALSELKSENIIRQKIDEQLIEAKNNIQKAYYKEKELNLLKTHTFATISKTFFKPIKMVNKSIELMEIYLDKDDINSSIQKLTDIKRETKILSDSIREIISIAEFDSNKIDLNLKKYDIKKIIENILNEYKSHNIKRNFVFKYDLDRKEFITDESYFKKIISNLISNAVKFSDENSTVEIEVSIINDNLTIKIKDDGIGIPNDFQDYLFEPFIRAENVGSRQGYGLGLTFVKKAVDLFGGEIICSSVIGEGTVISVYLPKEIKQV